MRRVTVHLRLNKSVERLSTMESVRVFSFPFSYVYVELRRTSKLNRDCQLLRMIQLYLYILNINIIEQILKYRI